MTPATEQKRAELQYFIKEMLASHPAVQGVIATGSMATGRMRPDSDIDAILFLDPFDWYIVPAEFKWQPSDQSFHSIFAGDLQPETIQLDFQRIDLTDWAKPAVVIPEGRLYELQTGWVAYDRSGRVAKMVAQRTFYNEDKRLKRLDDAIMNLDQHLHYNPLVQWETLGVIIAHDRLEAAFDYLVRALFALNRSWLPWRNRQMDALLGLSWLPENFVERVLIAGNSPSLDFGGYKQRVQMLQALFREILDALIADGTYSYNPADQAFIRTHDQPGYAWNMEDWNEIALTRAIAIKKEMERNG
jgi:hypothetical protein